MAYEQAANDRDIYVPRFVSCDDEDCPSPSVYDRPLPTPPPGYDSGYPETLLDFTSIAGTPTALLAVGTGCIGCHPALVDPQLTLVQCRDALCTQLEEHSVGEPIPTGPDGMTWWNIHFYGRLLQGTDGNPVIVLAIGDLARAEYPPDSLPASLQVIRCSNPGCSESSASLLTFSDSIRSDTHLDANVLSNGTVVIAYADAGVDTEDEGTRGYSLNLILCPDPSC